MFFSIESLCKKFWVFVLVYKGIIRLFLDGFLMELVKVILCWYLVRLFFLKLEVIITNKNLYL